MRTHARLIRELSAELEQAHGLPLSSYEVLLVLSNAPDERMRMAELAESVLLSPSGITRLVDRLVSDGLVAKMRCVPIAAAGTRSSPTRPHPAGRGARDPHRPASGRGSTSSSRPTSR